MSISNLHRNSTESNKHTPKGFTDATNNSKLIRDERGESRYVDNINIGTFIDFADPTIAPPTTTNNHVYILVGAGTVDANWGSAVENDIVRFFDGVPIAVTPTAGYFGYNLTENKYYKFESSWIEFATPAVWGAITGTLSDQTDLQTALDNAGQSIYNGVDINPLTKRNKIRLEEFLEAVDDNVNGETIFRINPALLAEYTSPDITNVSGVFRLLLDTNKIYFGGVDGLASQKTLNEVFEGATELLSDLRFHLVAGKIEPFMEQGKIWVGNANAVPESKTISEALDVLAIQTGVQFKVGIDGKVVPDLLPGYIFRGNANGEGVAQKLIQGNNKAIVTDESGNEQEVDLISFLDLLSASGVTADGLLNTTDLGGTARGVLGSWKITDIVIENTTANQVHINIGTTEGGNDIVSNFAVDANFFGNDIPMLKSVFSKTTEQALYISSSNWNGASLNIKFSVKKVF